MYLAPPAEILIVNAVKMDAKETSIPDKDELKSFEQCINNQDKSPENREAQTSSPSTEENGVIREIKFIPDQESPFSLVPEKSLSLIRSQVNSYLDEMTTASKVSGRQTQFNRQSFNTCLSAYITKYITQPYLDKGYLLSGASLEQAKPSSDGVLKIPLIHASLKKENVTVAVTPASTSSQNNKLETYIKNRTLNHISTPLNWNQLEGNLRLLRADSLINPENFKADLMAGQQHPPELISKHPKLKIDYTPSHSFYSSFSTDNSLPSSVGSTRLSKTVGFRSLIGIGDSLTLTHARSLTGGVKTYDVSYQNILNPNNGTLQFRISPSSYRITEGTFKDLNIHGRSTRYEINFRQPLTRSFLKESALSLGFTAETGQSYFGDSIKISDTDTKILKFGQDFLSRDNAGAWQLNSQLNLGFQSGKSDPFFIWQGNLQRQQKIGKSNMLLAQLDLQFTPQDLPTTQDFFLGGANSVRGYRTNAINADNGLRLSLEDQIILTKDKNSRPTLLAAPFLDVGWVWNHDDNRYNQVRQPFLASAGLGVIWQPFANTGIRLDYGLPLIEASQNGLNLKDSSLNFSFNYKL